MSGRKIQYLIGSILIAVIYILYALFANHPAQRSFKQLGLGGDVLRLEQNWTDDIRQQMNFLTFGSRLMPYDWFINLELADSKRRLASEKFLTSLGFVPQRPAANNPDALPVGFAIDDRADTAWIGLTCAACHMGELTYQGKRLFVDGGPGMMDFTSFEEAVYAALKATYNEPEKFERFARALKLDGDRQARLRERLKERLDFFTLRMEANATDVPYGYGRVDAFGQIFNAIAVEALHMPENRRAPNAPVSIPVLWDAGHLDLVQWNGSAPNKEPGPLGQNATTALAVYGRIDLPGSAWRGYSSTIAFRNLGYIQSKFYQLTSPQWPEAILGALDQEMVAKGRTLYLDQCASCHALIDRADPQRQLRAKLVPLDQVGTDPQAARNFVETKVKAGPLAGRKGFYLMGEPLADEVQAIDLVMHATVGAMVRHPLRAASAVLNEKRNVPAAQPNKLELVYKARPLNGIWAAAPYLHNGSVPTLYDLLMPAAERPDTFFVGNKELDVREVGFVSDPTKAVSLYDTRLQGNSNAGHEFGTGLDEADRWALVEFLKSL